MTLSILIATATLTVLVATVRSEEPTETASPHATVAEKDGEGKAMAKITPEGGLKVDITRLFNELGASSHKVRSAASKRLLQIAKTRVSPKKKESDDDEPLTTTRTRVQRNVVRGDQEEVESIIIDEVIVEEIIEKAEKDAGADGVSTDAFDVDNTVQKRDDIPKAWKRQFPNMDVVMAQAEKYTTNDDPERAVRARMILKECLSLKKKFVDAHVANMW